MKQLRLYGYSSTDDVHLLKLREVTLFADKKQVRALSEFFARCAEGMEANPEWEHEHFSGGKSADVIVFSSHGKAGELKVKRTLKKGVGS